MCALVLLVRGMATELVCLGIWAPAPEVSGTRLARRLYKPVKLCTEVKCFYRKHGRGNCLVEYQKPLTELYYLLGMKICKTEVIL